MEKKTVILLVVLILAFTAIVQAEVITIFDSNATISDGNTYDIVVVKGDGTVVTMTGGDVNTVITMNASTFNMLGGIIEVTNSQGIRAYDSSTLNLLGGFIKDMQSYGENQITISGDATITGLNTQFYGSSVITVSSPNVTIENLALMGESKLEFLAGTVTGSINCGSYNEANISGGQINRISMTDAGNGSPVLNISGGTVNSVSIVSGSYSNSSLIVRLSGGVIDNISVNLLGAYHEVGGVEVGVIGYGIDMVPYGGSEGYGQLTGYWNNDVYFSMDLGARTTYSCLTLHDGVIPPNCINRPESDLSGDCKVDFKDFSKMASGWLQDGTG